MIALKSISTRTLSQMALRISVVICLVTAASYYHLMVTLESRTKDNVGRYIAERGARERLAFSEAGQHHELMAREFVKIYQQELKNPRLHKDFDELVKSNKNGVFRNRDPKFNGKESSGIFIASQEEPSADFKARLVTGYKITERFGLGYHYKFQDTYITFPENAIVLYWPELPAWVQDTDDKYQVTAQEYYTIATPEKNPQREIKWSGLFYDEVSKAWMVTASTPIYSENRFLGVLHHDLLLNEIFERTLKARLAGANTYYIVREDGRLILHPDHFEEIRKSGGLYEIAKTGNETLRSQFQVVKNVQDTEVIESPDKSAYLAVAKIAGPGWFLVTSYPKSTIRAYAADAAVFVLFGGIVSLLLEITILYLVLNKQISLPLLQLIKATNKLAEGNSYTKIDLKREDELGQLASSFNIMTTAIQTRDRALEGHNQNLELLVQQRTKELDEQKTINLQASKMSSLGEMAGAIAHEINTPLATIKILTSQLNHEVQNAMPDLDNMTAQLTKIENTTDRVAKIVRGLKTFARDGSRDPYETVNVQNVIDDTVALCSEKMKIHNVDIRIKISDPQITMDCRSVQISQVLLNLLNNAYDAIEELSEKWIEVEARALEQQVEIRITDSGGGIDKDTLEKIFQPFFTTKIIGKGTGMGLSISLGILKSHHGSIFVDQTSQHTCFVLRFPQRQPATVAA